MYDGKTEGRPATVGVPFVCPGEVYSCVPFANCLHFPLSVPQILPQPEKFLGRMRKALAKIHKIV